jgi:glycosyltransferase involved in cell wall biosynthesis
MKKKIRIIYLVNHAVPSGSNAALLNVIDGMSNYYFEIIVVVGKNGSLCEELDKRNIEFEVIHHQFQIYPPIKSLKNLVVLLPRIFQMLIINFNAESKFKKIVKKFKPDLIHTNIGPTHIGYNVAKKMCIPHVWHIREYQDLDFGMHPFPSKGYFINKINSPNNNTIAITRGVFNHFSMSRNATVIYDGVMKEKAIQFKEIKNKYFLFLGRLEETKGIRQLLIAFVDFAESNTEYELLIAGNGSDFFTKEMMDLVNNSRFADRIHFLGFRKDVDELLSKATALIVPSKHEGFGFITVEAMFNGCLVIGNNAGGTKEILESENLGILYTGHDELVSALKEIVSIGIENYYPKLKKAQIIASKLYSQEQNANEIINLYREILRKKHNEPIR